MVEEVGSAEGVVVVEVGAEMEVVGVDGSVVGDDLILSPLIRGPVTLANFSATLAPESHRATLIDPRV